MSFLKTVFGKVEVELEAADPFQCMHSINRMHIDVTQVKRVDAVTIRFCIRSSDYDQTERLALHYGGRLKLCTRNRLHWVGDILLHRIVLYVGILLILGLTLYVPGRVLLIEVRGNNVIPDQVIIEAASQCGIGFGTSRKALRSEQVKNSLLARLPQLQWLGVNTYGCTAVISVEEKTEVDSGRNSASISSIVASWDGVIRSMTVSSGVPHCKIGQAVRAGQLLVSGYSDCGICIHGTRAEADIFADTRRELSVIAPSQLQKRSPGGDRYKKYALIIGKKRINLYKGSGISGSTCGKMYKQSYMSLPGGYLLPVSIVTETYTETGVVDVTLPQTDTEDIMSRFAVDYLKQEMISGEIISGSYELSRMKAADQFSGVYMCREMIGRIRIEETMDHYGENN